jgi:hypothetical protein
MKDLERERLVDALRERGVTYLAGGHGESSGMDDAELILALVQSDGARLRLALTPLFLSHPTLAEVVPAVVKQLSPSAARELQQRYTAAVCLQRFWRTRLREVLLSNVDLPDLFSTMLGLPSATVLYGRLTLWYLAEQMSLEHGGVDYWATLHKTFEDFMQQRTVELASHEPA